jgi:hypothetical protein
LYSNPVVVFCCGYFFLMSLMRFIFQ